MNGSMALAWRDVSFAVLFRSLLLLDPENGTFSHKKSGVSAILKTRTCIIFPHRRLAQATLPTLSVGGNGVQHHSRRYPCFDTCLTTYKGDM